MIRMTAFHCGTHHDGQHEVIERLIASGRDLGDFKNKKGKLRGKSYTALGIARNNDEPEAVSVLERFIADPVQTRHEVRVKLVQTRWLLRSLP